MGERPFRFGSVCSGIEAASVAWHPLGWRASFLSEIEAFPRAVLTHHYPTVPLHGDFTTIEDGQYDAIDLLVGGTPCQDFSVAGLRAGMAGDRGNLTLQFLTLARRLRPRWVVWENVPGVLSSNGGRDFGAFLGGLGELGYGWAYRTLDAQFFGLAQRRRRVFVVGHLGDWRRAGAVLFERHSLSGHPAPSREAGAIATQALTRSLGAGGAGDNRAQGGFYVSAFGPGGERDVGSCLTRHAGRYDLDTETFIATTLRARDGAKGVDSDCTDTLVPVAYRTAGDGAVYEEGDCTAPLTTGTDASASIVAIPIISDAARTDSVAKTPSPDAKGRVRLRDPGLGIGEAGDPMFTLQATAPHAVGVASAVRRLTPRECERLQGFPDDYTLIQVRGKPAADGPRYKALGNSMAVPVMAWIGRRIQLVEAISSERSAA